MTLYLNHTGKLNEFKEKHFKLERDIKRRDFAYLLLHSKVLAQYLVHPLLF